MHILLRIQVRQPFVDNAFYPDDVDGVFCDGSEDRKPGSELVPWILARGLGCNPNRAQEDQTDNKIDLPTPLIGCADGFRFECSLLLCC